MSLKAAVSAQGIACLAYFLAKAERNKFGVRGSDITIIAHEALEHVSDGVAAIIITGLIGRTVVQNFLIKSCLYGIPILNLAHYCFARAYQNRVYDPEGYVNWRGGRYWDGVLQLMPNHVQGIERLERAYGFLKWCSEHAGKAFEFVAIAVHIESVISGTIAPWTLLQHLPIIAIRTYIYINDNSKFVQNEMFRFDLFANHRQEIHEIFLTRQREKRKFVDLNRHYEELNEVKLDFGIEEWVDRYKHNYKALGITASSSVEGDWAEPLFMLESDESDFAKVALSISTIRRWNTIAPTLPIDETVIQKEEKELAKLRSLAGRVQVDNEKKDIFIRIQKLVIRGGKLSQKPLKQETADTLKAILQETDLNDPRFVSRERSDVDEMLSAVSMLEEKMSLLESSNN
jgi:hypothetical protein